MAQLRTRGRPRGHYHGMTGLVARRGAVQATSALAADDLLVPAPCRQPVASPCRRYRWTRRWGGSRITTARSAARAGRAQLDARVLGQCLVDSAVASAELRRDLPDAGTCYIRRGGVINRDRVGWSAPERAVRLDTGLPKKGSPGMSVGHSRRLLERSCGSCRVTGPQESMTRARAASAL